MCIDSLKLSLRQVTSPVQLEIGLLHREELKFLILEESTVDLIHGRPWLLLHSPTLSWKTGEVTKWGPECSGRCLPVVSPFQAVPIIALLPLHALHCMPPLWRAPLIRPVPPQYKQFEDVFCPDLLPGVPVPRGRVYPLALPERKAMEEYVEEALQQVYI